MAIITTCGNDPKSLAASLACEDFLCVVDESDTIHVTIHADSASDLRAKYNSAMRSLRASSEALSAIEE